MRIYSLFGLAAISGLLIACQSNTFKIQGHIAGLAAGDTLFMTQDISNANHDDTIIIDRNGNFEYNGIADSVERCALYNAKNNDDYFVFFKEPGVGLKMNLKTASLDKGEGSNSVQGSKLNEDLTSITNKVDKIQKEISFIEKNSSADGQDKANIKVNVLEQRIRTLIIHAINDNAKNELGFFLLTSYCQDREINSDVMFSLIHKLPAKMSSREEITQIVSVLKSQSNASVGKLITGFQMPSPENKNTRLYDEIKKNKITIIDFWASWCGPCRKEMPDLSKLYNRYHAKGMGIIGISFDKDASKWKKAIHDMNMNWVQMSDLSGWESLAAKELGITSIPFTIIVDNKGVILDKGLNGEELTQFIKEKLK